MCDNLMKKPRADTKKGARKPPSLLLDSQSKNQPKNGLLLFFADDLQGELRGVYKKYMSTTNPQQIAEKDEMKSFFKTGIQRRD